MINIEEAVAVLKYRHALSGQAFGGDGEARIWLDILGQFTVEEVREVVTRLLRVDRTRRITPLDVLDILDAPRRRQRQVEASWPKSPEPIPEAEKERVRPVIAQIRADLAARHGHASDGGIPHRDLPSTESEVPEWPTWGSRRLERNTGPSPSPLDAPPEPGS